ncbi:SGNH hydrolase-type esterase domain-containing protein [Zychaea mexicana]|uniref:SGNH hydrolase-type esterase domain-containing protein n=1 Tax=Zychaea mexicana TaxID=64656 RepID=UPI0022FF15F2|nr:SGNH hydrolase-type esterase domain-containing protein [Zychaea mexicana]KAI9492804.1 SGNH hydrolase-type esterase domain-containing protein [Zychaea mexicana]
MTVEPKFPREKYANAVYQYVSSYQILQRNENNIARVKLANGKIQTFGMGGPYVIDGAHSVYVGDIWVMAGQSNMRGHGYYNDVYNNNNNNDRSAILEPKASIHLFQSNERWAIAQEPTHKLAESPRAVHRRIPDPTVRNPSALNIRGASLGLAFAQSYQKHNDNNVPVGLIASAHGGTSTAQWMERDPKNPSNTLYGAMMERIAEVDGNVAGFLWYQGETDACSSDPTSYSKNTIKLIKDIRHDMDYDIPVVCVQLGRCIGGSNVHNEYWTTVRENQYDIFMPQRQHVDDRRLCAVSSIDAGMDDFIHLSARGLVKVGHRLGLAASYTLQGKAYLACPRIKFAGYEEKNEYGELRSTIKVTFDNVDGDAVKWSPVEGDVLGFSLHTQDHEEKLPIILSARIEDERNVRIYLTREALHLHGSYVLYYGWGKNPCCNLTTTSDMALLASSIRFAVEHAH